MTRWRAVGPLLAEDPRRVAGFEVVGRLGQGGMGVVYLAEHAEMGPAALKLVRAATAADETFRARFRREVEAADRVRSPRVAPVLAADPDAETPWLATAFVDGPTLYDAIDDAGPMEGERLVALAVALADALAAIHRAGVVHRDLKPTNILLTPETPVVIDFGIASLRQGPELTRAGVALGTPGWMAPEQVRGRRPGPRVDVFAWGLVVAYAASGRPVFGKGPADAVYYRIVHETPDVPPLPPVLDRQVRAALTKDPRRRPTANHVLESLTAEASEVSRAGTTVVDLTLADHSDVVPTIVALGWGADALPARLGGHHVVAESSPAPGPGSASGPAAEPAVGADSATSVAPGTLAAPPFWFAGAEHLDARSLAAALQSEWDGAVDQLFRRRNPILLEELHAFLRPRGLAEADRLVSEGTDGAPAAATMARLLTALDRGIEPRVGPVLLTPEGLAGAARAVLDGRDGGERLAEIRDAHVLRLWRSLPRMERAAWIDERWQSSIEAFNRLVATVSPQAGWPTPAERHRAAATLLLCAVHPDHERQLARRLRASRLTAARHQPWWAQLAAEGQHAPAAAVLALMTAERARTLVHRDRGTAREAARGKRKAERRLRDAERLERQRREAADHAARPLEWRYRPLPRAQSGVRRMWVLLVVLAALLVHLWAMQLFGDQLIEYYGTVAFNGAAPPDELRTYQDLEGYSGLAGLLVIALPGAHVATRAIVRRGARRGVVRLYAGASAALDLLLGLTLVAAATMAVLVLGAGIEGEVRVGVAQPFADDQPWGVVAVQLPFGLVGLVLAIRSLWRLPRAVFGRPVAGPPSPAPPQAAFAHPPVVVPQ
jgi:predicted Ser/Thr protein kinase